LVHVDCAFCSFYCLSCLWYFFEAWDSEQLTAFEASYSSVGSGGVESASAAAFRAMSDDLHLQGPFGKLEQLQLANDSISDFIKSFAGVHHKFGIEPPIISHPAASGAGFSAGRGVLSAGLGHFA